MNQSDIALSVENVSKIYRVGVLNRNTLKADLQSRMALWRGKEDPNSKIGEKKRMVGDKLYALDDVSFKVRRGERLGILGKNGAGKSTLLKLICRITTPSAGHIGHNGRVTSMLEVGMGFHPELTGRENIYMSGAILGMTRKEIDERFDQIVEFSEVGPFIDTPVKRYSSGMYVRLGFSVSAHLNSEIVIMDEVLAVGDMTFQEKCIRRMREIAEDEKKTILYVSHNMFTVHALCDRCIVLEDGKLIYDGDVNEAERLYRLEPKDKADLTKVKRIAGAKHEEAIFLDAKYAKPLTKRETELETVLKWKINKDIKDMHLRIEVRDEMNHAVGAKIFYHVGGGKAGDICEESFTVDTSSLRNGRYRTVYVLFRILETQETEHIDSVEGLPFEINDPARREDIIWHRDWWGTIRV